MSNYDKDYQLPKNCVENVYEDMGYKENDDKFKCPSCGKVLLTFDDKKLEGNLFCFHDDCDVSIFMSASKFKDNQ